MSFSSQIKEKLCKSEYGCMHCAAYELSGALMFGGNIGSDSIKFATENENIAKRITADINTAYGIQVETQVISKVQRIIIDNIYQVENITGGISQSDDIPFSCCRASFVRGAFLGGGSVTDPQKGYHMEFNTKSDEQALRLQKLLKNEGFNSKITYRKGYNVVYIKGSEEIADILGYMGAAQGAFELFSRFDRVPYCDFHATVSYETKTGSQEGRDQVFISDCQCIATIFGRTWIYGRVDRWG